MANFCLLTCHPPSSFGTRTQATSDAFAMSSPAARATTVSIVMTLLLPGVDLAVADRGWEPNRIVRLTHVLAATLQGTSPGSRVPFRNGLAAPNSGKRPQDRSGTTGIFDPPGRPDGLNRSADDGHTIT
jgi:hypothetical protein